MIPAWFSAAPLPISAAWHAPCSLLRVSNKHGVNVMGHTFLDDISKALIREAEKDCAASDPDEIGDAAAMVLVGDVYSLRVCHDETPAQTEASRDILPTDDAVSPFIR